MYYLIATIQVYFISELVKQSGWVIVTSSRREMYFNNCIRKFHNHLHTDNLYKVCDTINNKEDFTQFVNNTIHCIIIIYILTRQIVSDYTVFDLPYWSVVTLSTIAYSFLNNFTMFQFSFQQTSTLTYIQVILCITISCLMILLIGYQVYMKRIKYKMFILPISMYIMTYILFRSITDNILWHFHHAITFGFLSLCFTDFQSIMNRFMHAIMIGGVIQAINIYGIHEIFIFSIDYHPVPSFVYLCWLCTGYFICWNITMRRNTILTCRRNVPDDNNYIILPYPYHC